MCCPPAVLMPHPPPSHPVAPKPPLTPLSLPPPPTTHPLKPNTEYEVDFINNFEKLTSVGTKFDNEKYLTPEQTLQLKF